MFFSFQKVETALFSILIVFARVETLYIKQFDLSSALGRKYIGYTKYVRAGGREWLRRV
ncbi:hypothetical protein ANT_28830 [Anaerolinea thermophila UNI-1]|uniref:Uncharacterized protein n=1 Tax=Anaerolinea thermophila (strain DSM 14523 / JCM 11388 / NBRC 100420 / UNI-1) TaxID=926569 RepID=E8N1G6_ANATU|nr:hypothetical protein ANT_28830 [Anaerolinea thermophila UNI-1]